MVRFINWKLSKVDNNQTEVSTIAAQNTGCTEVVVDDTESVCNKEVLIGGDTEDNRYNK